MSSRRVVTIDCQYVFPEFAAAYLIVDSGDSDGRGSQENARAAFIDNNTAHSVPLLLAALQREGLTPEQVDFVIITHVHLDHAGGTSQLMKACPNAKLLAHPRAAKHMIDPARLVRSARLVYGAEAFDKMYGVIEPIPENRVQIISDEETIPFGRGAPLRFLHTRGHANHHMCIFEPETGSIFTGDSFGLAYPALQRSGLFIFPSTSPTDFDYEAAVTSVDRIVASGATTAYPTHFGAVTELDKAATQLKSFLKASHGLMERTAPDEAALSDVQLNSFFEKELTTQFENAAKAQGLILTPSDRDRIRLDLELNAQGLAYALRRSKNPSP